jgi:sporulation protein YlmC with PRC-barrel domain
MKETRQLVPVPPLAGQTLDAQLHLLDRQVLDSDGVPVTTLDDIELGAPGGGDAAARSEVSGPAGIPEGAVIPRGTAAPVITALLTGPVLGTRIFGGRPPSSRLIRIPWKDVADVGVVVRLGVSGQGLDADWVEHWIRDKIIARIPGSGGRRDPR